MIDQDDYWGHAEALIRHGLRLPDEISCRRAISATYYGLFHALCNESAALIAPSDPVLRNQVRRSFNHRTMRNVCDSFVKAQGKSFPQPYDRLLPASPNAGLFLVAEAFTELQEARHTADYDLAATISWNEANRLTILGYTAWTLCKTILLLPETQVFLTALLLSDRWTRRG